jgi:type IV secretory pathway protease TraF
MTPSLNPGELVLVRDGAFEDRDPRRGEIVAARPSGCGGRALVKRVRGLPSERVSVDGRHWHLGPEEFFLMSDCAGDALDSRVFGPVTRRELIGPVWARVWPWTVFLPAG